MKKITMGITLAALCLSVGTQDVDAGLFSKKPTTSTRAIMRAVEGSYDINQIENCLADITEAQAALNTMITTYAGLMKILQRTDPSYKGMDAGAKTVFTADKKILDVLRAGFDAAVNGSSESVFSTAEKDVARLKQDRNNRYASIQSYATAQALLAKYEEAGLSSGIDPTSRAGRGRMQAETAHNAARTELDEAKRIIQMSTEQMQTAVKEDNITKVNQAIDAMIANLRSLKSSYAKADKAKATFDAKSRAAETEASKRQATVGGATAEVQRLAQELKTACDSFHTHMTNNPRPEQKRSAQTTSPQVAAIEKTFSYYKELQDGLAETNADSEDRFDIIDATPADEASEEPADEEVAAPTKKRGFLSRFSRNKTPAATSEAPASEENAVPAEKKSLRSRLFGRRARTN